MSDNEEFTEANAFSRSSLPKRVRVMGPMDRYVTRTPPPGLSLDERREHAKLIVYYLAIMGNLPKKFINSKCTKELIEALSLFGPGSYPIPTEEDLRGRLLTNEVNRIKKRMLKHRESWEKHGCSILVDAWSDRRWRCLVIVYVHSQLGTRFVRFVATAQHCIEFYMVELIAKCVKSVGPKNVVQVVCDGTPFCVQACESIQEDWPHIFRTPCTSYLIDKMLCALPRAKLVLFKAKALVGFIYNHKSNLRLLGRIIGKKGLVRVGVTGPTTTFFILRRLLMVRSKLVNMFTEDECKCYKWWGHPKVDAVIGVVHNTDFWRDLYLTFRVMGPLVKVLYVVHSLKYPPMGFIYAAMQQAKDEMKKACLNQEELYKPVLEIIDRIWGTSADRPLYMAGYYLNPFYFYGDREIERNQSIMNGLIECVQQMYADDAAVRDKIVEELGAYREAQGPFGNSTAVRQRSDPNINPGIDYLLLFFFSFER
jgi:Protein of unknown function (DUF 659)